MNTKVIVGLVILLVVVASAYFYVHNERWSRYENDVLTFEYPSDWNLTEQGHRESDEVVGLIRVEGEGQVVEINRYGEGTLIPGCDASLKVGVKISDTDSIEKADKIVASVTCY